MTPDSRMLRLVPAEPPAPPIFEHIGILGLGEVGASLALAARNAWPAAIVIGVDSKEVLEQAVRLHAVDVGASDLSILSGANLIVLTGAAGEHERILQRLADYVEGQVVLTNVDGVAEAATPAVRALPPRFTFVGGRPAIPQATGDIRSAHPDLFRGQPWVLAAGGPSSAEAAAHRRLRAFLTALGASVQVAG